ncbi:hypothetical protein [Parvularcula oceani]|uniref:hypothetical protein n=1 Tax=Parvularcula oceani TaxID=1247963 RepID=UPI0004E14231|nr:hypothetical protein [Parvularcula oceani]
MTENDEIMDERDAHRRSSRKAAWRMAAITAILLLGMVALFPVFVDQDWFDFRPRILILLTVGVVATILMAAGLMAAAFHSDRSGHDDEAGRGDGDGEF